MTHAGYMIWFIATAVMIITLLTIGTLAAAELLPRRKHSSATLVSKRREPVAVEHGGRDPQHHDADQHRDHAA